MKKTYFSPEMETIKLNMRMNVLLEASGETAGQGGEGDPNEDLD